MSEIKDQQVERLVRELNDLRQAAAEALDKIVGSRELDGEAEEAEMALRKAIGWDE